MRKKGGEGPFVVELYNLADKFLTIIIPKIDGLMPEEKMGSRHPTMDLDQHQPITPCFGIIDLLS